jgi:hypothetical protein
VHQEQIVQQMKSFSLCFSVVLRLVASLYCRSPSVPQTLSTSSALSQPKKSLLLLQFFFLLFSFCLGKDLKQFLVLFFLISLPFLNGHQTDGQRIRERPGEAFERKSGLCLWIISGCA